MKETGIYMIQSISKPERVYIGSAAKDIRSRLWRHLNDLRYNRHGNIKLQNHYNKYGEADLVFEIVESGEYIGKNHLLAREQGWFIPYGYKNKNLLPYFNILPVAGSTLGSKQSSETIEKRVKKLRGRTPTLESLINMGRAQIGNKNASGKRSEAFSIKLSELRKGQPSPMKGKHHPPEYGQRISEMRMGHKYSEKFKVPIFQYDKQGNFIKEWPSAPDAAKALGISRAHIPGCLTGKRKSAYGFVWRYKFDKVVA